MGSFLPFASQDAFQGTQLVDGALDRLEEKGLFAGVESERREGSQILNQRIEVRGEALERAVGLGSGEAEVAAAICRVNAPLLGRGIRLPKALSNSRRPSEASGRRARGGAETSWAAALLLAGAP